jgi:uncharacterized cupin superfamily protein
LTLAQEPDSVRVLFIWQGRRRMTSIRFPSSEALARTVTADGETYSFLATVARDVELEPWPLPTVETEAHELSGDPERYGRVLWRSDDGRQVIAIERVVPGDAPCVLRGVHGGEVLFYLEGRVIAHPPAGEPYELGPGSVCRYDAGMPDCWDILEPTTKVFVASSPDGRQPY